MWKKPPPKTSSSLLHIGAGRVPYRMSNSTIGHGKKDMTVLSAYIHKIIPPPPLLPSALLHLRFPRFHSQAKNGTRWSEKHFREASCQRRLAWPTFGSNLNLPDRRASVQQRGEKQTRSTTSKQARASE